MAPPYCLKKVRSWRLRRFPEKASTRGPKGRTRWAVSLLDTGKLLALALLTLQLQSVFRDLELVLLFHGSPPLRHLDFYGLFIDDLVFALGLPLGSRDDQLAALGELHLEFEFLLAELHGRFPFADEQLGRLVLLIVFL